jgi:hypothetical protein
LKTTNDTPGGQRQLAEFVKREVIYNASTFMFMSISKAEKAAEIFDDYTDTLYELSSKIDYETPARENGWIIQEGQIFKVTPNDDEEAQNTEYADSWQEACEIDSISGHENTAYEHWIVTQWLAEKLQKQGEIVGEFAGFTIWGRCTSGQAIHLDAVIETIYNQVFN